MSHDVFISYSSLDKEIADTICDSLEKMNIKCWYAPRNIEPGSEWAESIVKAIENSKILVLIFTENSNNSKQVLREVTCAVDNGISIVPIKISDTQPTESFRYYLNSTQWIVNKNGNFDKTLEKLVILCTSILIKKPTARKKSKLLLILLPLIALVIVFGIILVIRNFTVDENARPILYAQYANDLECQIDNLNTTEFVKLYSENINKIDEESTYTIAFSNINQYYHILKDFEKTEYIISFADENDVAALPDSNFCKVVVENINVNSIATDEEILFYVKPLLLSAYPNNSETQINQLITEIIEANNAESDLLENEYMVYFETPRSSTTYAYGGIINMNIFKNND